MPRKRIETRMEIENEVPDPPNVLIENISEDRIEPIAVDIDEIPFDDCKLSLPDVMTNEFDIQIVYA